MEFQQGNQASSRVEAWNSAFLSSCKRGVRTPAELSGVGGEVGLILEVQQGRQTSLHVVRGNSGFHSCCCQGIRLYLELRGNLVFFGLASGTSGFLSHFKS